MAEAKRRAFLKGVFGVLSAAVAGVVTWPVMAAFLDPLRRSRPSSTTEDAKELTELGDLPVGTPIKMEVISRKTDAWDRSDERVIGAVWLLRKTNEDVRALSSVCPHLGCSVGFDPAKRVFACPCHESAFRLEDGTRIMGPSPRGLDPLPVAVKNGKVFVTYKRFVQGIASRREA